METLTSLGSLKNIQYGGGRKKQQQTKTIHAQHAPFADIFSQQLREVFPKAGAKPEE